MKKWDVFCNIVDNFGDIGVCWRLAKQLVDEHPFKVRLFINDFYIASQIIPNFDPTQAIQTIQGIEIQAWPTGDIELPNVVIENFSCQLPAQYIKQICAHNQDCASENQIRWINLEYLSAEKWVEGCHQLASIHPTLGYKRYFFYPGFTEKTGGLLREANLMQARQAFTGSVHAQNAFWEKQLPSQTAEALLKAIKISLFSYPQADIESLIHALLSSQQKVWLLLPYNAEITALNQIIQKHHLSLQSTQTINNISLFLLPFLSQIEYDQLLWACDLNFVRGEDSWIRAILAGKPFIWQPYIQTENTHIKKLDAFLDHYLTLDDETNIKPLIREAHHVWSNSTSLPHPDYWLNLLAMLPNWYQYSLLYTDQQVSQASLTTQIVTFANSFDCIP
jgi:uncharacterized repeat protein (TIGR03837 family)